MKSNLKEVQISYERPASLGTVARSKDAEDFARQIWQGIDYQERFVILVLNRNHQIMGYKVHTIGGISGVLVDPKLVFQTLLVCHASAFICIHNHPSGNLKPSQADLQLTDKLKHLGQLMDLPLLDHLIITSESYLSMADEGIL